MQVRQLAIPPMGHHMNNSTIPTPPLVLRHPVPIRRWQPVDLLPRAGTLGTAWIALTLTPGHVTTVDDGESARPSKRTREDCETTAR